jgi:hypothetical protein
VSFEWLLFDADGVMQAVRDGWEDNVDGARSAGLVAELFPHGGGVAALRPILARQGITL